MNRDQAKTQQMKKKGKNIYTDNEKNIENRYMYEFLSKSQLCLRVQTAKIAPISFWIQMWLRKKQSSLRQFASFVGCL